MEKINGMIFCLSSRKKCLKKSLESLYENYNNKFDYPVYIYYFDDIYDDQDYVNDIKNTINNKINFYKIDYGIPCFLEKKDLFYKRSNNYARNFGVQRTGYLHMINFFVNSYYYPGTHLKNYDFCFHFDDETLWTKKIEKDFFKILQEEKKIISSFNTSLSARRSK